MKKIIIIGGGPGGYVTAIKAAQLGAEVQLVESNKMGGTCLNVGCIPTKVLLHSGLFYKKAKDNVVAGIKFDNLEYDWKAIQREKAKITRRLVRGVEGLLSANGVIIINGKAKLIADGIVEVDGEALPKADAVIIASGSRPVSLNFTGSDLSQVIDSTDALSLEEVPESIAIVGGGVIGVEFAAVFNSLGSKLTIIEMMPKILPTLDDKVSAYMNKSLQSNGVDIFTAARLTSVKEDENGEAISEFELEGEVKTVNSKLVLIAVGRTPNIEDLGLEENGIEVERKGIVVDENFETTKPGIFAIGDCNGKMMLAHAASAQGEAVVEYLTRGSHNYNGDVVPSCVYTDPEIACVGKTELQAIEEELDYEVGEFDLLGNGKAMIDGIGNGFVKIIVDKSLGKILGAHMVGTNVTEMIGELSVVMTMEGGVEEIISTIHAHPTVSESIREAAMATFGNAIHWPPNM